jgi:tetratricopeptide (TPR) repeat protein
MQMPMTSSELEKVVRRVLNAVRSFSEVDGDSLAEDITTLRAHLAARQDFFEVARNTTELQAVSLVFDYEDSRGGSFSPAVFIVGRQMLDQTRWLRRELQDRASDRLKWGRQVVWALMAYALWMHRNNKLRQMSEVLDAVEKFIKALLCHHNSGFLGTRSRFHFYRGLQQRDQGDFESATENFQESFRFARERHDVKIESLREKPNEIAARVEEIFYRCCLTRVQAFGFGEVAFFKGDLAGALAWFRTAMAGLENHQGLQRWPLAVEVYLQGASALISQFTLEGRERITTAKSRLEDLARRLASLHRGYSELADAFSQLANLRLEQMGEAEQNPANTALTVNLTKEVLNKVSAMRPSVHQSESKDKAGTPVRRHGAISTLISLICAEILFRGGREAECREEVKWIREQFESNNFAQTEADLLEIQLDLMSKKSADARSLIDRKSHNLQLRANRNQRAFWWALASLASADPAAKSPLSAGLFAERANSIDSRVRHGFVNHFVQAVVIQTTRQTPIIHPMPYQEATPNFSLKANLNAAIENVLKAVTAAHPEVVNREQLSGILGYEKNTTYGRHNQYIERWLEARGRAPFGPHPDGQ